MNSLICEETTDGAGKCSLIDPKLVRELYTF